MGTWLATIHLPGGTRRYARYSTVVNAVLAPPLYAGHHATGDLLPDGERCHRPDVAGDPLPHFPEAPLTGLIAAVISVEPDDHRWHALYSPARAMLLGPHSGFDSDHLQSDFDLVRDVGGVRHLRAVAVVASHRAACGADVPGDPLPFRRPLSTWGVPELEELRAGAPPIDIYAEWGRPDLCADCLLGRLLPARSEGSRTARGWWRRR